MTKSPEGWTSAGMPPGHMKRMPTRHDRKINEQADRLRELEEKNRQLEEKLEAVLARVGATHASPDAPEPEKKPRRKKS